MLVCEYDPRTPEFYIKRHVLEKETVKLKGKRTEHSGIKPAMKRKLVDTISTRVCTPPISSSSLTPFNPSSPIVGHTEGRPAKRLRRSSDRDISNPSLLSSGIINARITRSTSKK